MFQSKTVRNVLGIAVLVAVAMVGSPTSPAATGDQAPFFELNLPSGDTVSSRNLRGRVVVLDFWASWCPPCRRSLPQIQALEERYLENKNVFVFGVNDEGDETVATAMLLLELSFMTVQDDGSIAEAFRVDAIPRTIVIGPDGCIVADFEGLQEPGVIEAAVERALDSPSLRGA